MRGFWIILFWAISSLSVSAEKLPIRVIDGLILIDVKISPEMRTLQFLVDTGAEESVLSCRAAAEMKLNTIDSEEVITPSGRKLLERSEPITIHVGNTKFSSSGTLCMDLRHESKSLKTKIDGLLGMDFLKKRSTRIDFKHQYIDFSSSSRSGKDAVVLPLKFNNDAVCIAMNVNEKFLSMVRIDTGCDRTLCWIDSRQSQGEKLASLKLGSHAWGKIKSICYKRPIFPGEDGLLGMGVLGQFKALVLDPKRQKLILEY